MLSSSIDPLARAARMLCGEPAIHHGSVLVHVQAQDRQWKGYVEFFSLERHPPTTRVFAWYWDAARESGMNVVLNTPPLSSPHDAVLASLGQWDDRS